VLIVLVSHNNQAASLIMYSCFHLMADYVFLFSSYDWLWAPSIQYVSSSPCISVDLIGQDSYKANYPCLDTESKAEAS
jgi:hypothetical protein